MDIIDSRKLQLEINRRLDSLEKSISEYAGHELVLIELQDLKEWIIPLQISIHESALPGRHRRQITEKELKIAAKECNLQFGVIGYLINWVRKNQSKSKGSSISDSRDTLIDHINKTVKIQHELWDHAVEYQNADERKLFGKYMAYKELADGLKNEYFKEI